MPDLTQNIGLKKPLDNETADIAVINQNMDIIDAEIAKKASITQDGRMAKEDKQKLDAIEEGATNYIHPSSHPANIIIQDSTHRFVSDTQIANWDGKVEQGAIDSLAGVGRTTETIKKNADDISNLNTQMADLTLNKADKTDLDTKANQTDLERVAYDLYALWLEQYYLGEITNSPNPLGAKSIIFDGFLDENNIDTVNTTALVDTSTHKVMSTSTQSTVTPVSGSSPSSYYGGESAGTGNTIDGNTSTCNTWYGLTDGGRRSIQYDLGAIMYISEVKMYMQRTKTADDFTINSIAVSEDGVNWTVVDTPSFAPQYNIKQWFTSSFSAIKARYIAIRINIDYNSLTTTMEMYEVKVTKNVFNNDLFVSKSKDSSINFKKVKLYASYSGFDGYTFTPLISFDGGANYLSGSLVSSRQDSKFSEFTECEYEFNSVDGGSNISLKVNFDTDTNNTFVLKRYGLLCYE